MPLRRLPAAGREVRRTQARAGPAPGDQVDGFIASETATLDGFRGFSMKPEVLISEADKVVAYVVFEGIHNNEMHGYKPTGKKVRISLMMLLTIEGGKIKEKRAHFDYNDIVRQIS